MDETLGVGELDDINLPLDEIIYRKAQRERQVHRPFRRGRRSPARRTFARPHRQQQVAQQFAGAYGETEMAPEVQPWQQYDDGMQFQHPVVPMQVPPYWQPQMYPQPPPPGPLEPPFRQPRNRFEVGHPQ